MEFTLLNTIKENFSELFVIITGMMYGVLFGVVGGLVLLSDLDEPVYTQDAHSRMFYVSISGLILLGICMMIIIQTFRERDITKLQERKD